MANIKSAKKRIKTIDRRHGENKFVKSTLATYVKNFNKLLQEGNIAEAESKLTSTISYIDSACSKGILTRNTASRKISRLSRALYKAKVNGSNTASEVVEKVEEKDETVVKVAEAPKKATRKTATKATTAKATATKTTKKATKKEEK